jgi:hypothetical protein
MPEKETLEQAREDARQGKATSTQAGEFVREEMHHIREGKHGARSTKQAIAIGLSGFGVRGSGFGARGFWVGASSEVAVWRRLLDLQWTANPELAAAVARTFGGSGGDLKGGTVPGW